MPRKPLSTQVFEALRERIRAGVIAPGAQLPTEAELCQSFDVSRTVVREAVARLRSEGLVVPRQGKGVFVSEAPRESFNLPDDGLSTLPQTLALLELRLGVEVEAAGLCAARRSEEEARAIRAEMERADAHHPDAGAMQVHYDRDFHLAIARGAHNAHLAEFLAYITGQIDSRLRLGHVVDEGLRAAYFERVHAEHLAIVEAIERRQPDRARRAMRHHLTESLERLRALARARGLVTPVAAG
ncbi:MAG: FadR family transcriptional regulator [Rhodobacteraceae bacterium]|nr:FadR family transcriptional regulator [Paracoccaceae bacterium]